MTETGYDHHPWSPAGFDAEGTAIFTYATINGIMYEIEKAMKRTGDFRTFLQHRAVGLSNGGLAIESSGCSETIFLRS